MSGPSRRLSLIDFILRIVGAVSTLGSTIAVATTNKSLPTVSKFIHYKAHYQDFPTFKFLLVTDGITATYLVLSLTLSIFHICWAGAKVTRTILIIFDTIILALLTAAASAATSITFIAHNGNDEANWVPICQKHSSFCGLAIGSLVGSFIAALILLSLVFLSSVAISKK